MCQKVGKRVSLCTPIPKTPSKLYSFLGECEVAIDAKGRFLLPSGFRKQLGEEAGGKFVVKREVEKCLTIYPIDTWKAVSEKINRLNDLKESVRLFKRL